MWVEDSDHPYRTYYLQYRKNTEWKNDKPIQDERKWKKKAYGIFWHLMSRKMAVMIASVLINKIRPIYAKITTKLKISTIAKQSAV